VRFELEDGPDISEGRRFYHWTQWFEPGKGASFSDGSMIKSGVWDLSATNIYNLPYYNLVGTQGRYSYITVVPSSIPEPATIGLIVGGLALARAARRRRKKSEN